MGDTITNMSLAEVLDDLTVRFLLNLPASELSSVPRLCFQVEEAQWFYEDFIRPAAAAASQPLPSLSLRQFCLQLFAHCPLFSGFTDAEHIKAYEEFLAYKVRVPVRGAILMDESMEKLVLVKGWKKGASWSFPRGKINKDEKDLDCAIREVYEETGYDVRRAGLVPDDEVHGVKYIDVTMREQHMRLFVFRGVAEDTHFEPQTRKEISKIAWYNVRDLPGFKKTRQGAEQYANKFYMVAPFLGQLKRWISQQRRDDAPRVPGVEPSAELSSVGVDGGWAAELMAQENFIPPQENVIVDKSEELRKLLSIGVPAAPTTQELPSEVDGRSQDLLALLRGEPKHASAPRTPFEQINAYSQHPPPPHPHILRHPSEGYQIHAPQSHYDFQRQQQQQQRNFSVPNPNYANNGEQAYHSNYMVSNTAMGVNSANNSGIISGAQDSNERYYTDRVRMDGMSNSQGLPPVRLAAPGMGWENDHLQLHQRQLLMNQQQSQSRLPQVRHDAGFPLESAPFMHPQRFEDPQQRLGMPGEHQSSGHLMGQLSNVPSTLSVQRQPGPPPRTLLQTSQQQQIPPQSEVIRAQGPGAIEAGPAVPKAENLPKPKLNAHSMALLNAFKSPNVKSKQAPEARHQVSAKGVENGAPASPAFKILARPGSSVNPAAKPSAQQSAPVPSSSTKRGKRDTPPPSFQPQVLKRPESVDPATVQQAAEAVANRGSNGEDKRDQLLSLFGKAPVASPSPPVALKHDGVDERRSSLLGLFANTSQSAAGMPTPDLPQASATPAQPSDIDTRKYSLLGLLGNPTPSATAPPAPPPSAPPPSALHIQPERQPSRQSSAHHRQHTPQNALLDLFTKPQVKATASALNSPATPISPFTLGTSATKVAPQTSNLAPEQAIPRSRLNSVAATDVTSRRGSGTSTPTEASKGFLLGFLNDVVQKEGYKGTRRG